MSKDWGKRHDLWLEKFPRRLDPPPGGWAKYLGGTWMERTAWFTRYNRYLKSTAWKTRRFYTLKRAGQKCQLCPATTRLEIHHVTYDRVGAERVEDLRCLCHGCHRTLEANGVKMIPMDKATREVARHRAGIRNGEARKRPVTRRRPAGSNLHSTQGTTDD